MFRVIFVSVGFCLMLGACTQRMICPAYQSTFIYDQEALRKRVSYFNEDSTPKVITVSKTRYLMVPEATYRKKIRSMQTIPMKYVYPKVPDSLLTDKNKFAGAEEDKSDSTLAKKKPDDSVYAITKDKELRMLRYDWDSLKYRVDNITLNADQDNYMWYFRDVLVLPDVRAALEDQKNAKEAKANPKKAAKEKTGFFGFFKNIFKKKPKPAAEATVTPADSTAAASPDSPDSTVAKPPPPVKKKKGLFGFLKKKNDADNNAPARKKDPAKKEDDGF